MKTTNTLKNKLKKIKFDEKIQFAPLSYFKDEAVRGLVKLYREAQAKRDNSTGELREKYAKIHFEIWTDLMNLA